MPRSLHAEAFGVQYIKLDQRDGSQLMVTRYGLGLLPVLDPNKWYENHRYSREGKRLAGTSTVYRVPVVGRAGRKHALVVKFSRLAQDVPIVEETVIEADRLPDEVIANATFNSPFEEFGHVMAIRRGPNKDESFRIRTKRPLAIYRPAKRYSAWRLGRSNNRFARARWRLQQQEKLLGHETNLNLEIDADYVVIYEWTRGIDAAMAYERGLLTAEDLEDLTHRVSVELRRKGYMVLDHKPSHFIVRPTPDGGVLRRHGQIVYTLIDFELLQPIAE